MSNSRSKKPQTVEKDKTVLLIGAPAGDECDGGAAGWPEGEDPKAIRMEAEVVRLQNLLAPVPDIQRSISDGLIRRAAYMLVTLEQYEADLDEKGYTEWFTQSERTPPYERERPVARLYNAMVKNYQSAVKQLVDLIPAQSAAEKKAVESSALIGIIGRGRGMSG